MPAFSHSHTLFSLLQPQAKAKKTLKRKSTLKFSIDCSQPVDDGIMDAASFEKFLLDRIKVSSNP